MAETKIVSPLRLQTYRDERNNTQTFQWVLGEYESQQLARWKSVIDGAEVIVQRVDTVDIVAEMYFNVTANATEGDVTLNVSDAPTMNKGAECVYGGDLAFFDITQQLWNINALQIFLNGVKQKKGEDVFFDGTNTLRFTKRLQVGDLIVIDHFQGV